MMRLPTGFLGVFGQAFREGDEATGRIVLGPAPDSDYRRCLEVAVEVAGMNPTNEVCLKWKGVDLVVKPSDTPEKVSERNFANVGECFVHQGKLAAGPQREQE